MELDSGYRIPGQLIEALLEKRGWTKRILAVVLRVDETGLNKIIAGKRPLDADLAIALGEVFELPPERFFDLQKSFDLAQAQIKSRPDPQRAARAHLFGGLPIAEMVKRSWLDVEDVRDVPGVERALAKFFGVDSAGEIEILPHAAKKTDVTGGATPVQLAWLYRVKQIACNMLVAPYSVGSVRNAVSRLRDLLSAPEESRKVPRILAESGIRYLIVESLPGAKIDGVCFWLDDRSPVVAMSLRYDRMDNFWFVLRHEIEHVLQGHGREAMMLDAELEGDRAGLGPNLSDEERAANKAAAEFCVSQNALDRFIARKDPLFPLRDILGFAKTIQVHPALVAGQLQHRTGRYDRFKNLHVPIRSAIKPSAMVDGWGDVALSE